MRRHIFFLLLVLLAVPARAFATWSIVAVDRSTGRVVIASATCVDRDDEFLKGVQAVVVPGKGVAACQAAVDNTHANQMLVFQELQKGTDPKAIIEMLSKDPAFQSRELVAGKVHTGRSEDERKNSSQIALRARQRGLGFGRLQAFQRTMTGDAFQFMSDARRRQDVIDASGRLRALRHARIFR